MTAPEQLRISNRAGATAISAGALGTAEVTRSVPLCPLCRSAATEHAFRDSDCELRVCSVCELFFVHPYPPSRAQHERAASGKYAEIELLDCARRQEGERHYFDRHFALIAGECQGASSFLDVGCGTGQLLAKLAGNPHLYRAGIELNPQAAEIARRVSGCEIFEAPIEEFHAGRKFDVITMINVFSHIPSFDRMFASLRAALAPGGKLVLRSSEMARRVSRWNQLHWGIPDDLHFLGLGTLEFLCRRYGFAIARHLRTPFEEELFLDSRWRQMGRSSWVNLAKRVGVRVPGGLAMLKGAYTRLLGRRFFISFIVLKALADAEEAPRRLAPDVPAPGRGNSDVE